MSDIRENQYTLELAHILEYMTTVLLNEFPTNELTLEYLILAILDNRNCHANLILDNCLMSDNLEELRKVYVSVLQSHSKPQLKVQLPPYNPELNNMLSYAEMESEKLHSNEVGTEHILLAILNSEYGFKETDVFEKFKLDYDYIFNKCSIDNTTSNKPSNNRKNSSNSNKRITKRNRKTSKKESKPSSSDDLNLLNDTLQPKGNVGSKNVVFGGSNNFISQYTVDINKYVSSKKSSPTIGMERELREITEVLGRKNKNNVILIGEGGVGKTQIVYGLAEMINNENVPPILEGKKIVMLDIIALISGTHFRGMFEERVDGLFKELKGSTKYILFLDDIHNMLKSNGKDRDGDLSSVLSEILNDGSVKVIATTTPKGYKNTMEINQSLARKFQRIEVEAPSIENTLTIVKQSIKQYEEYHNVKYSDEAIEKAVKLADRYITDRKLPDSAFDIIDLCGSRCSVSSEEPQEVKIMRKRLAALSEEKDSALNNGDFEVIDGLTAEENVIKAELSDYKRNLNTDKPQRVVCEKDILDTVGDMTNIPTSTLSADEKEKIAHIDSILKKDIIGQDEAIEEICKIIKRNRIGLGDKAKTLGNALLCGPSGCGKTLLAKKLAEEIFGSKDALVRIDMSEYSEKSSISKLTGSNPGYVGYENGGILTEAVKHKQHCLILLDEIEKANEEVYNIFLQLFDDGRLTDGSGQVVNFKNVIVLMTSNIGSRKAEEFSKGLGFSSDEDKNKKTIIEKELKKKFSPEFLNRLDKIIYFNELDNDNLLNISKLETNKFNKRLNEIGYSIECDDKAINVIHMNAIKDKKYGARPIRKYIQDNLEDKVTELILEKDYKKGYVFHASSNDDNEIVLF